MNPLNKYIRWAYLIVFTLLFIIIIPIVTLYASGYRYKPGFGIVRTGGIYVSVPYSNARILLNGEVAGYSGLLQRGLYIDNLAPSAYVVQVEREGNTPWTRVLVVEPQLVTDAHAFLFPKEDFLVRVAFQSTASGTQIVSQDTFEAYLEAFATSSPPVEDVPIAISDNIGLYISEGDVIARWMGGERTSSIFCGRPSFCGLEIAIERGPSLATDAVFFGGGVVYRTTEGQIFFSEVDLRPQPITILLYSKPGADMRIIDDELFIKDGNALYRVEGF